MIGWITGKLGGYLLPGALVLAAAGAASSLYLLSRNGDLHETIATKNAVIAAHVADIEAKDLQIESHRDAARIRDAAMVRLQTQADKYNRMREAILSGETLPGLPDDTAAMRVVRFLQTINICEEEPQ